MLQASHWVVQHLVLCCFNHLQAVSQMVVAVMHAQQDLARDTALASAARQRGKEDTLAFRVFHVMANQEAGVLQVLDVRTECMQSRGILLQQYP
jgi:hypothetical protein